MKDKGNAEAALYAAFPELRGGSPAPSWRNGTAAPPRMAEPAADGEGGGDE
jgi:hypothetical protein